MEIYNNVTIYKSILFYTLVISSVLIYSVSKFVSLFYSNKSIAHSINTIQYTYVSKSEVQITGHQIVVTFQGRRKLIDSILLTNQMPGIYIWVLNRCNYLPNVVQQQLEGRFCKSVTLRNACFDPSCRWSSCWQPINRAHKSHTSSGMPYIYLTRLVVD